MFAIASQDIVSKIASCWFIIGIFATLGYEHIVANMYNLTISQMYGSPVSYGYTVTRNLLPTLLGSILSVLLVISFY